MAKWIFSPSPIGVDQGPNNPTAEHFKSQEIFSALVRESIQNSLDVPLSDKPVEVRYAFGTITGELNDSLKEVEQHVIASKEAYPDSTQYQRMADFLETHKNEEITYLRVSDYNTTGMNYKKGDNTCGFYSFVQSIGNSSKNSEGAGGSYGFGKAAYYEFSNSRSVLVSSRTEDGQVAFQGCSMLCTHYIGGDKINFSGFFDGGDGTPIQEISLIPEKFQRNVSGSDIYILHVDSNNDIMKEYEDSIVRSVLLNFWTAIYKEKLVVYFDWEDDGEDEIEISKDKLDSLMDHYFPEMIDKNELNDEYCNPRPYYEAVKSAVPFVKDSEEEQSCVVFSESNLRNVGKIEFYLMRNIGTKDRYLRMRKRYMVIDSVCPRGQRGISGVLICEDGIANDSLKKAEPPAHDMWDIKRVESYKNQPDTLEQKAYKAINAIKNYANKCIREYFANSFGNEIAITDTEQYLYATEDTNSKGGNTDSVNGRPTDIESQEETSRQNQKPSSTTVISPSATMSQLEKVTIVIDSPSGTTPGGNQGPINPTLPKPTPTPPGPEPAPKPAYPVIEPLDNPDESDDNPILQRVIKDVTYRISKTEMTETGLVYYLKVRTNEDLKNADLMIVTLGEDGEEEIPLDWSETGVVSHNMIRGIDLYADKANVVQFRFEDNIKHLITLTAYVEE